MRFAIIATGASLDDFNPLSFAPGVHVIVVNGGYMLAPDYHEWFTLDPSRDNLFRLIRVRNPVMALDAPGVELLGECRDRVKVLRRVAGTEFGRYRVRFGMSDDPGEIYTGNSATGAIQYAVHSGAKRIAVFGMDGGGKYAKQFAYRPLNLKMLPSICDNLAPELERRGVEVVNASPESLVTTWRRVTVEQGKNWIENA